MLCTNHLDQFIYRYSVLITVAATVGYNLSIEYLTGRGYAPASLLVYRGLLGSGLLLALAGGAGIRLWPQAPRAQVLRFLNSGIALLLLVMGPVKLSLAQTAPATSTSGHPIIALQGRVLHPQGRDLVLTDHYGNELLHTQIHADGRFQLRARWGAAQPATLQLGNEVVRLWLTPGDNLILTLDARRFDETLRFLGRGSRVNNYRAAEVRNQARQQQQYRQTLAGPESHFRAWLVATKRRDAARLATAFPRPTPLEKPFVDYQRGELYFLRHQGWERRWPSDHLTRPGRAAPAFRARDQRGQALDLAALRGRVVYVDFWASWCGFCLGEAPAARALHAALADRAADVAFLNVSLDDDWDKWQCALEKHGVEGLNVVSPDSGRATAGLAYALASLPRYVLIGPDGRIVDGNAPRPSSGAVEKTIRQVLQSPTQATQVHKISPK